ncbi:hypothetical protein D8666_02020 [Ochrobactrum soli]|nr:hypothetical protein D8666_02020 [[Ochrobactrum] soli]
MDHLKLGSARIISQWQIRRSGLSFNCKSPVKPNCANMPCFIMYKRCASADIMGFLQNSALPLRKFAAYDDKMGMQTCRMDESCTRQIQLMIALSDIEFEIRAILLTNLHRLSNCKKRPLLISTTC